MNDRIIVMVQTDFDDNIQFWLDTPSTIQDAGRPKIFPVDPDQLPPWTQPLAVQERGLAILAALRQHPAVAEALSLALHTNTKQAFPLYFHLKAEEAERVCWETLCDKDEQFLSLKVRWPIARIAQSDTPPAIRSFAQPLRIMALLSAVGIKADKEWRELRKAVTDARAAGLEIHLRVYVGQQDLLDGIAEETQQGLAQVEALATPPDIAVLKQGIADFLPHILHFFCHGVTDFGIRQLELGTILDEIEENPRGSLQVNIEEMASWPELAHVWLVTLNCCKSSQSQGEQYSMAHVLVTNGVPAAVGMLEPIEALDAHTFCGRFYQSVFEKLHEAKAKLDAQPEEQTADIVWAEALWSARVALAKRAKRKRAQDREWALPVLYVQRDLFQLRKPAAALTQTQLVQLFEVARLLRSLPDSTPPETRQELLAVLSKEIPPGFRPDAFGRLPGEHAT